jgi:transcriptional regulator of acetoin/glycerol metabolism
LPPEYVRAPPRVATRVDPAKHIATLTEAMHYCRGNVTRAAARAGMSRPAAYRLAKRFCLDLGSFRPAANDRLR